MTSQYNLSESIARDYYNSSDADNFYYHVWGGEDIHIGLYQNIHQPAISKASKKTIEKMLSYCHLLEGSKIMDLGSGYGGSARYIAKKIHCKIDCLNISEEQNNRNKIKTQNEGLSSFITVIDGSFENIPTSPNSYDLVWSQDAILHSSNKPNVFEEVSRILKKNGQFIFTDPMQKQGVSSQHIQPVLDRIHLDSMGSFELYEELAKKNDLIIEHKVDLSENLLFHYSSVLHELQSRYNELILKSISKEYIDTMIIGLNHWIDASKKSLLSWGIMKFIKK
jgi:ubiquinone/menaquinone biosynthesis C-methylase UbiE